MLFAHQGLTSRELQAGSLGIRAHALLALPRTSNFHAEVPCESNTGVVSLSLIQVLQHDVILLACSRSDWLDESIGRMFINQIMATAAPHETDSESQNEFLKTAIEDHPAADVAGGTNPGAFRKVRHHPMRSDREHN